MNWLGRRVDSRKAGGVFNKMSRANRYGQIRSVGSRSKGLGRRGKLDLISCVQGRSGGWNLTERGSAALVAGDQAPRRRCAEARRTWPNLAVRGSNRPVFGSGVTYGARVVHLGSKQSSGRLGAALAWAAAGPRGGDSPACARVAAGEYYKLG